MPLLPRILAAVALLGLSLAGFAAQLTPAEKAPAPPPSVEPDVQDATPEVRIVRTRHGLVSEYRMNGRLYMVRFDPRVGPPYYLVDMDGDGRLESRRPAMDQIQPPQWVLFSWQ